MKKLPLHTSLPEWTKKMIQKVQHDPQIPSISSVLTEEGVVQVWRITKEHKASSYSGRYNAVYK